MHPCRPLSRPRGHLTRSPPVCLFAGFALSHPDLQPDPDPAIPARFVRTIDPRVRYLDRGPGRGTPPREDHPLPFADELRTLRPQYMAAPFWFWNDVMDPAEVRRQIVEMHAQNIGGFFMHARMGRVTPYMGATLEPHPGVFFKIFPPAR